MSEKLDVRHFSTADLESFDKSGDGDNEDSNDNVRDSDGRNEPHIVDLHVGGRLKRLRLKLCVTQKRLADMVGLTFQQIQKYEKGCNRISCSKLYEFAQALQVHVSYFFEGLIHASYEQYVKHAMLPDDSVLSDRGIGQYQENLHGIHEQLEGELDALIACFRNIKNYKLRKTLLTIANAMRDIECAA